MKNEPIAIIVSDNLQSIDLFLQSKGYSNISRVKDYPFICAIDAHKLSGISNEIPVIITFCRDQYRLMQWVDYFRERKFISVRFMDY